MGKTENLCKNPVRFFLFKRFFGVSKETEKQLLNQQLIALLKSKERPKWHQTFHDFHVCCGTLLKYTSGIKWCLAADSDLKAFLNEHTGKWLLPELACLGFQHCAVLQELKTPSNDMQTKWWAAASLFCSVCVCCRCVTLSVLQVQNSSNLGQRHQCDVFERWRWSRLPQRTLKCVDHLVSLPCNLRTHTHTHPQIATLAVNVKKGNLCVPVWF